MRCVAFLRAINVGGHTVTMTDLARRFSQAGCRQVATFIASGNVVFTTEVKDLAALERKLEKHLAKSLGYEVRTFIRTDAEVAELVRYQAFPAARVKAAHGLYVGFVRDTFDAATTKDVLAFRDDGNDFHVRERELFWLSRGPLNESTFSYAKFEKALGTKATFRNVNTIRRIAAKYGF